jgi:hypothetical protein
MNRAAEIRQLGRSAFPKLVDGLTIHPQPDPHAFHATTRSPKEEKSGTTAATWRSAPDFYWRSTLAKIRQEYGV